MSYLWFALTAFLIISLPGHAAEPTLNAILAKEVGKCAVEKPTQIVHIFKQWHLSPATRTKDVEASKKLPQFENQTAIYKQLKTWIAAATIKTVFAEGCSGEIKS